MIFLKLVKRNLKVFFKDKGAVFASLIAPLILLVLYFTFLADVFKDILANIPDPLLTDKLKDGIVGGQMVSTLLSVCSVTVACCVNMTMVSDKVSGAYRDFLVSPVKSSVLAVSYFTASLLATIIICVVTLGIGLIYIACVGWYMNVADIFLMLADVFVLAVFGTALSSAINVFLTTNGQISAVGTIISAGYGFISGAYMPLSQLSGGVRDFVMFLPGVYGTSLLRNHALGGAIDKLIADGAAEQTIKAVREITDCDITFFDKTVSIGAMYGVFAVAAAVLIGVYVLVLSLKRRRGRY